MASDALTSALRAPLLQRWALGIALAVPLFVIGLARLLSRTYAGS